MAETFTYEDILNTLIELETKGNLIYTELSKNAPNLETQKLFLFLAEQELAHKDFYTNLKADTYTQEVVDPEYQDFVEALLDHTVKSIQEAEEHIDQLPMAVRKAKHIEMETLVLLNELKKLLGDHIHVRVDRLMDEERRHLKLLYDIEKHGMLF